MKTLKAFIRGYSVFNYYVLTFAISWGAVSAMVVRTGMPVTREQMEAILPVAIPAMLLGPSVSALIMIGLVDGRSGFHDLLYRFSIWRVGPRWYAMAILLAPILFMAVLMALSLLSPVYLPGLFTREDRVARIAMGLVSALAAGICEEIGWAGFVTPRLRKRHRAFTTGIIIGVLWGIWHIVPIVIIPAGVYASPLSRAVYITAGVLKFTVGGLVAFRVLMVWVYDRTESLLLQMIMHAGLTAANIIYEPQAIGGTSLIIYDIAAAATLWIVVGIVLAASDRFRPSGQSATR